MFTDDLLWLIALSQVTQVGPVHARALLQHFGNARSVFQAGTTRLEKVPGIGSIRASHITACKDFRFAEKELRFIEQYRIRPLCLQDPDYPQRLFHTYDAPILLYYRGSTSLNTRKIISIIGTRTPTDYGKDRVRDLLPALAPYEPLIVSGLAYGIDTLAHKYALKNGLPTLGILAHGLDRIYPHANKGLAREMVEQGGLLTDFPSGTNPDAVNFPRRNRIVAGLSDAVVVIETGDKGGSMITARMANDYDREIFALPGRITDAKSAGCLTLIRENRAHILTRPEDIATVMGWDTLTTGLPRQQTMLPLALSPTEQQVLSCIAERGVPSADEIRQHTGLGLGETATALLSLEMQHAIATVPGGRYRSAH